MKKIFFFIMISISFVYLLFFTEIGGKTVIKLFETIIPGQLNIKTFQGKLLSDFSINDFNYQSKSIEIKINAIHLRWHPLHLFKKKIDIAVLDGQDIQINVKHTNEQQKFTGNVLPFLKWISLFSIHAGNISHLNVHYDHDEIIYLDHLQLKGKNYHYFLNLFGTLKGFNFKTIADFIVNSRDCKIENLMVSIADASLILKGNVNKHLSGDWTLNIPNLNQLFPDLLGKIEGKGELNNYILSGNLLGEKIDWLNLPQVHLPKGHLSIKLNLKNGENQLQLTESILNLEGLGVQLNNIILNANYQFNHSMHFQGQFKSGEGQANIVGSYALTQNKLLTEIDGDHLNVIDVPEYRLILSPHLKINYEENHFHFDGNLLITKAIITPKDFSAVLTLPSEVIIENEETENSKSEFLSQLFLNLKIELGNEILIKYNHLDTHLAGQVQIIQVPGSLLSSVGELHALQGKYELYGHHLQIEKGRLIYAGNPILNPGIDILAVKEIKKIEMSGANSIYQKDEFKQTYIGTNHIKVGILLKGTLQNPRVLLYSNQPGMSQTDILSYLIFGYPRSQMTEAKSLAILSAYASTFSLGSDQSIKITAETIKKKLGINEFGFRNAEIYNPNLSQTVNETVFSIGKKLGKKLYLRYSIGIFNPIQILNLKYQLSKRLSLQSETSTFDNGADLIYEIEKD